MSVTNAPFKVTRAGKELAPHLWATCPSWKLELSQCWCGSQWGPVTWQGSQTGWEAPRECGLCPLPRSLWELRLQAFTSTKNLTLPRVQHPRKLPTSYPAPGVLRLSRALPLQPTPGSPEPCREPRKCLGEAGRACMISVWPPALGRSAPVQLRTAPPTWAHTALAPGTGLVHSCCPSSTQLGSAG